MAVSESEYDGGSTDFAYTERKPPGPALSPDALSIFVVPRQSDTGACHELRNDPLDLFRRNIPELLGDEDDVRAMVLRVNAERSANPHHRSEVWIAYPGGSKTAVGLQFKYSRDMLE